MLLYHASPTPGLDPRGCVEKLCRARGFTEPHYCFTSMALAGMGSHLVAADVPLAEVKQYAYENVYRGCTSYALPIAYAEQLLLQPAPWRGHWNILRQAVMNRRHDLRTKDRWAVVWGSRVDVATVKLLKWAPDHREVEIRLAADFDPAVDWVVAEEYVQKVQRFEERLKELWTLKVLAGGVPQWVSYPALWKDWVWNPDVRASALAYLQRVLPDIASDIRYAEQQELKHLVADAWQSVAEAASRTLSRKFENRIDLGSLPGHSWTAVAAMPLRIANRISDHLPYEPWLPPLPRPEFENPDFTGRIVLANETGTFPATGTGISGTRLPNADPFPADQPRRVAAVALVVAR